MAETNFHTNLVNVFIPIQKRHLSPGLVLKQHWLSHTSWMFFVVSGEHQPSMSTDSDTSLIMPVELVLSDVELQSDPEQDDAKSWSAINGAGPHRDNEWTWAKAAQVCNLLFWPHGLHHRKKTARLSSSFGCIALNVFCPQLVLPDWKSHMVLRRMCPLLFWKILTVSISLWDHCQYTPGYSKMNICNASMNAPYICFECLKRFACALTSSSYGPVSDAPCEVSPVLIVYWTLFLHLQICVKSRYSEPRNPARDMVSVSAAVSSDSVSWQCLWITMPQTQVLSAHFVLTKCCHLFR